MAISDSSTQNNDKTAFIPSASINARGDRWQRSCGAVFPSLLRPPWPAIILNPFPFLFLRGATAAWLTAARRISSLWMIIISSLGQCLCCCTCAASLFTVILYFIYTGSCGAASDCGATPAKLTLIYYKYAKALRASNSWTWSICKGLRVSDPGPTRTSNN